MFNIKSRTENAPVETELNTNEYSMEKRIIAVDRNLIGIYNGDKYEIGHEYDREKPCDVFKSIENIQRLCRCRITDRWLHVMARVVEDGDCSTNSFARTHKISVISEFSEEEYLKVFSRSRYLKTYDDIQLAREMGELRFLKNFVVKNLVDKGYSETFSIILANSVTSDIHSRIHLDNIYKLYEKAVALADEGISIDMRAYLLLTAINE